eukprot:CAMPEP_0119478974 /NCGR_PEP_ID=MMETSP1344-20130328/8464_1 /TAXON_ID=236787 /ORGANISM="Florenciella parvula, Strain CCMP2471" /LENGTH=164 /DNA_ID=CAMNT_0007513185 /DNA_START=317 /DNA_END=810 /DNA_ORIENTATION=+
MVRSRKPRSPGAGDGALPPRGAEDDLLEPIFGLNVSSRFSCSAACLAALRPPLLYLLALLVEPVVHLRSFGRGLAARRTTVRCDLRLERAALLARPALCVVKHLAQLVLLHRVLVQPLDPLGAAARVARHLAAARDAGVERSRACGRLALSRRLFFGKLARLII